MANLGSKLIDGLRSKAIDSGAGTCTATASSYLPPLVKVTDKSILSYGEGDST